jgi:hypothetical protein
MGHRQGTLYLSEHFVCFLAKLGDERDLKVTIELKNVQATDKDASVSDLVEDALRITTKDGREVSLLTLLVYLLMSNSIL